MRHKRGIDLDFLDGEVINYIGPLPTEQCRTFQDIREWQTLGAHCARCEREGWLLRSELQIKWGNGTLLASLTGKLRCRACGNKTGNTWILGKLPR